MHPSVWAYVNEMAGRYGPFGSVLDVGSYDDKGSAAEGNGSVRAIFPAVSYHGVDIREGPGVDEVISPGKLPFPDSTFGLVVSTEVLEHDARPWETVAEMARVARKKVIVTARGFDERGCYEVHGGIDLWRFTVASLCLLVSDAGLEVIDARSDPACPGAFVTAAKPSP